MYLFYQLSEEKNVWILVHQQISLENFIKITYFAVLGAKTQIHYLDWQEDPETKLFSI